MNTRIFVATIICGALTLVGCAAEAVEETVEPEEAAPEVVTGMPTAEPTTPPSEEMVIPQTEFISVEQVPGALGDSISYLYMIRPDDYLTKIAYNEYGNPNQWRRIYSWNHDRIGDDPNLIYPYNELDLFKPESEISPVEYDYVIHEVVEGETLWEIAGTEYGDEKAWIVLFWDNEDVLSSQAGFLRPGMSLKVRTRLW